MLCHYSFRKQGCITCGECSSKCGRCKKIWNEAALEKVDNNEPNNLVYVEEISGKGCCYEFLEIR